MTRYFRFTGNAIDVVEKADLNFLCIQPTLETPLTTSEIRKTAIEKYLAQVKLDLPRGRYYVNEDQDIHKILERLKQTDHLKIVSYTQGNFDGRVINYIPIVSSKKYMHSLPKMPANQLGTYFKDISFFYLDDNSALCCFSFAYLRDDSDQSIEEPDRKRYFSIAIIRHVNADPAEREVLYIPHPSMLPEQSIAPKDQRQYDTISHKVAISDSKKFTHSQSINILITALINENDGSVNIDEFNKLDTKIEQEYNLKSVQKKQKQNSNLMPKNEESPILTSTQEIVTTTENFDAQETPDPRMAYLDAFQALRNNVLLKRENKSQHSHSERKNKSQHSHIDTYATEVLTMCRFLRERSDVPTQHLTAVLQASSEVIKNPSIENAKACVTLAESPYSQSPQRHGFSLAKSLLLLAGFSLIALSIAAAALSFGALSPVSFFGLSLGASAISVALACTTGVAGASTVGYTFFQAIKPQKSLRTALTHLVEKVSLPINTNELNPSF